MRRLFLSLVLFSVTCDLIPAASAAAEPPLTLPPTAPPLQAWDATLAPADVGGSTAVSLLLHNPTSTTAVISGASSPIAEKVLLQHYVTQDGVTQIYPLNAIDVPADHELDIEPFGLEIRLLRLTRPAAYGTDVPLVLHFANGTQRTIRLTVQNKDATHGQTQTDPDQQ